MMIPVRKTSKEGSEMSVAVRSGMWASALHCQKDEFGGGVWMAIPPPMVETAKAGEEEGAPREAVAVEKEESFDIWSSIVKEEERRTAKEEVLRPYEHPLGKPSSALMSQKSLEICTESLGSENGSDGFSSADELESYFSPFSSKMGSYDFNDEEEEEEKEMPTETQRRKKELTTVNYHCSIGRRSPQRSFPPPLPSTCRRDGTCIQMRPHRFNGRLVLKAVPVPSHTYLHANRKGGRLLLSLIHASFRPNTHNLLQDENNEEKEMKTLQSAEEAESAAADEEVEDEEEEEVQVVDRGAVVEVKVSTQPQLIKGAATVKVLRSSLVINKFVIGTPLNAAEEHMPPLTLPPRISLTAVTSAAAVVAAASVSTSIWDGFHYNYLQPQHFRPWGPQTPAASAAADAKLLFTSKRRSREELLDEMRRCSELRRPLFIFEQPSCIAATS